MRPACGRLIDNGVGRNFMVEQQDVTRKHLRAFIERIERLEEEKAALSSDIREVYSEAKSVGFDAKVIRTVIRLRKQDDTERREHEALLATYLHALGMAPDPGP